MPGLLPLFPLQLVAFPGSIIPLHIFEPRYKEMVGDAAANGTEFGIVLAKEDGVVNAGCTVVVETVLERYPDGRFDVMTRGQRRFEITALNQEKDYLRGEVEFFDDEDDQAVTEELRKKALSAYSSLQKSMEDLGSTMRDETPDEDEPQLSFQLAQAIEDLDFQHTLLRSRSESERLVQFMKFAQEYVPRRKYTAKIKKLAPMNGFGQKPGGV